MNVIIVLGGIHLLSASLASIMNAATATAILGVTAGVMSWFSSTSGVVMPTLIPTVPHIIHQMSISVNPVEWVTAISMVSNTAGISPPLYRRRAGPCGIFLRSRRCGRRNGSSLCENVRYFRDRCRYPFHAGILRFLPLASVRKYISCAAFQGGVFYWNELPSAVFVIRRKGKAVQDESSFFS